MSGVSTGSTSALTLLSHRVFEFLDSASGAVRVLTLDFSKAFDKVLHEVILCAASRFDIPCNILCWLKDFLRCRQQRVLWNGRFSSWSFISSGVPQGSVLGPLLFTMVVDELKPVFSNSCFIKYADDVSILHFVRSPSEDNLQGEFNHCVDWSKRNSLPLNFRKCNVLDICTKRSLSLSPVCISSDCYLPRVDSVKILGVYYSSDLRWNTHVSYIVSKASRRIFIIRNLRRSGCSSDLIFKVYVAFMRSVLLYAYPSFCNLPSYLTNRLVAVEKRVRRIIAAEVNQEDITQAGTKYCTNLFNSILSNPSHPLRALFEVAPSTATRSSSTLRPPFAKTKRLSNSFIKFSKRLS